ncbi:MAG: hypothetical protein EOP66_04970 [Sphingomonas sp.]|nr:MAG: hypothetical protein EOP66_04970 [Sphingomonas sp.]
MPDGGGGKGNRCCVFLPLRHLRCHLPLAGEDRSNCRLHAGGDAADFRSSSNARVTHFSAAFAPTAM